MKKRFISLAIAIPMLLAALLPAIAPVARAAGTEITIVIPEDAPNKDDVFDVTVDISGNPGLAAVQFTLAFDTDKLTCLSAELGEVLKRASVAIANPDADDGAIIAAASLREMSSDGFLAHFRFRANVNLDSYSFSLKDVSLSRADRSAVTYSESVKADKTDVAPDSSAQKENGTQLIDGVVSQFEDTEEKTLVSFTDTAGHWAEVFIAKGVEKKLFNGVGDGKFAPNANITRADFVTILWRANGSPEPSKLSGFIDVPADSYYAKPVAWAKEKGYIDGYSDTIFGSKDNIQRQAVMKILFAASGGISGMELMFTGVYDRQFADSGEIASWAKPGMYWAVYNGIISGSGDGLFPAKGTTRAEMAKIIVNYLEKFQNKEAMS